MSTIDNFELVWKFKADTFSERLSDGIVCIIIDDPSTTKLNSFSNYRKILKSGYTEDNINLLLDIYTNEDIKHLTVVSFDSTKDETIDNATKIIDEENVKFNYLASTLANTAEIKNKLITFVKLQRQAGNRIATLVLGNSPVKDNACVISLDFTNVTMGDGTVKTAEEFSVYYASACACCDLSKSMTYHKFTYVKKCDLADDADDIESNGGVYLFFDRDLDCIVGSTGINTKTTIGDDESKDLKDIRTDRIINMIYTDMKFIWKNSYLGVNNSYKKKKLLVGDFNSYFRELESNFVLDDSKENSCNLDRESIIEWLDSQGVDTSKMKDEEIFSYDTDINVFVDGVVNITKTMEKIKINMDAE